MADLQTYQYVLIALIFVWSSFVRSGLGFGGAVFSLPFLLLITNQPLVFLPIIAVHLLFFSAITVWQNHMKHQLAVKNDPLASMETSTIDWAYLKYALKIMIIPKMVGVLGLLTIPGNIMSGIIFSIISVYAVTYILNKPFQSKNKLLDVFFLMLGGYISGTSLIGAPLIISVFATKVSKYQLRDTLFVLWFILVSIKMSTFIIAGVDLQLIHHLWLLPAATVGHLIGLRFHEKIMKADQEVFYRLLGIALLGVCVMGIITLFIQQ